MKWLGLFLFLSLLGTASSVSAQATSDQYMAAGNQFYTAKDYAKAVLYYKAAFQVSPNNAGAHQGLGNTYYAMGQKADALAEYQKALALNPNNPQLASFVQTLQAQVGTSAPAAATSAAGNSQTVSLAGYHPVMTSTKNFEFDVEAGAALENGTTGFGGGVAGYLLLDHNLGIGGIIGAYVFGDSLTSSFETFDPGSFQPTTENQTSSDSLLAMEILVAMKYKFDGSGIKPYLIGGVGLSLLAESDTDSTTYSPSFADLPSTSTSISASTINPMIQFGGGSELSLGSDTNVFAEAKYSLIIGSGGTSSYIPIDAGINFAF